MFDGGNPPRLANSALRNSSPNVSGMHGLPTPNRPAMTSSMGGIASPGTPLLPPRPLSSSMGSPYGMDGYSSPYGAASGLGGYPPRYGSPLSGSYGSPLGSAYGSSRYLPRYGAGGMYGSAPYGSAYGGGGLYGGQMGGLYGSRYGGGGLYGGQMMGGGMYGSQMMGGMYGQQGRPMVGPDGQQLDHPFSGLLESGHSKMQMFYSFIESFGRLAEILEMNFSAFHGSFSALFAFVETIGDIWQRFHWAIRAFTLYKFVRILVSKLRDYFDQLSGRPPRAQLKLELSSSSAALPDTLEALSAPSTPSSSSAGWLLPLLVTGALFVGGPLLISSILRRFFAKELDELEPDVPPPASPEAPSADGFPFEAVALYDFVPQAEGDLEFRQGEKIAVLAEVSPGWYAGSIGFRRGILPAQWVSSQPQTTSDQGASL